MIFVYHFHILVSEYFEVGDDSIRAIIAISRQNSVYRIFLAGDGDEDFSVEGVLDFLRDYWSDHLDSLVGGDGPSGCWCEHRKGGEEVTRPL